MAVAFALRVATLGQSLYGDELYTYADVVGRSLGDALRQVHALEDTPPLYFLLAWLSAKLGDPAVTLRLPSLLLGTAAVPVTYLLGRRMVSQAAALVGAALVALSPFLIFHAGDARAYGALLCLAPLSTLALLRVVDGGGRGSWFALVGATAAALMTHYTAVFVVAAQLVWAVGFRAGHQKRVVSAHAVAALGLIAILLSGSEAGVAENAGLFPFSLDVVAGQTARALVGGPFTPLSQIPGSVAAALVALAALAALAGARREALHRPPDRLVLAVMLALAAPAGVLLYSAAFSSIFTARNLTSSLPALALLAGAIVSAGHGRRRRSVAIAALLVAFLVAASTTLTASARRPPFDAAARFIDEEVDTADGVVQLDSFPVPYPGGRDPLLDSLRLYLARPEQAQRLTLEDRAAWRALSKRPRIFVSVGQITGLKGVPPPPRLPVRWRLVARRSWDGFAPVAVFVYRPSG